MTFSKERICSLIVQSSKSDEISFKEYSPLFQVLEKYSQSIFLYGEGGKGKSTAAQYLLRELYKENREGYYLPLKLLKPIDGDNAIHSLFKSIYHTDIEDLYIVNEKPIIVLDGINEAPEEFKKHDYFIKECQRLIERVQIIIIGRTNRIQTNSKETIKKADKEKYEFDDSIMIYVEQQELPIEYVRENIDVAKLSIDVQKLLQNNYNFTLYTDLSEYEPDLIISNAYELAKLYYNVAIKTKFVVALNSDKNLDVKEVYSWLKYFEYECATGSLFKKWDKYCSNNDKIDRRINNAIKDINLAFKKLSQIAIKGSITANKINDYFGTYIEELNHLSLIEKRGNKYFFVNDKARDYFQTIKFFYWLNNISIKNVELKVEKCLNFLDCWDYTNNAYFNYLTDVLDCIIERNKKFLSEDILLYYHYIIANNNFGDVFEKHSFEANEIIKGYTLEELIPKQSLLPYICETKNNLSYIACGRGDYEWAKKEQEERIIIAEKIIDFEEKSLNKIGAYDELKNIYYKTNETQKEKECYKRTVEERMLYINHSKNTRGIMNQVGLLIEGYLLEHDDTLVENLFVEDKIIDKCYSLYLEDKKRFKEVYVRLLRARCHLGANKSEDCLELIFNTIAIIFENNEPMNENNATDWLLKEIEQNNRYLLAFKEDLNYLAIFAKYFYYLKGDSLREHEWALLRVLINQKVYEKDKNYGREILMLSLKSVADYSNDINETIEMYERAFPLANQNGTDGQISSKREIATNLIRAYYERLTYHLDIIEYNTDGRIYVNKDTPLINDEKKKIQKIENEMWFFDAQYKFDIFEKSREYLEECLREIFYFQEMEDIDSHKSLNVMISILYLVGQVWCKAPVEFIPNQDTNKILLLNSEINSYTKEDFLNNLYKTYILLNECFRFICTHSDEESKEFINIVLNIGRLLRKYKLKYYCLSADDFKTYFKNKLTENDIAFEEKEKIRNIIRRIESIWETSRIL